VQMRQRNPEVDAYLAGLTPDRQAALSELRSLVAGLNTGKSCIRFRQLEKLPLDTVRDILQETLQKGTGVP
jgi:hypothetical protein